MLGSPVTRPDPRLPADARELLEGFRRATGRDVRLWQRLPEGEWDLLAGAGAGDLSGPSSTSARVGGADQEPIVVDVEHGSIEQAEFLASVLTRMIDHDVETRFFSAELVERYEEITLLYSIAEILGSVISLEVAARTILDAVIGTLRASRAALWIYNAERERLELVAAVGGDGQQGPVEVDDPDSVTAAVFRDRFPKILESGEEFPRGEMSPAPRRSFLSVPVSYTPPQGDTRTIGVMNLVGRSPEESFSAGDQKLMMAIASQIGSAVENSRLVAASLRQERIDRELELAHHLQLKLLPSLEAFEEFADVAARCRPADSVGGDFYHLFRLTGNRIGVMIGDVSTHGFGAALIMALTMSAVAIHASEGDSPAEVLRRTHRTLINELESTEMYLTLFYGVIDPERGEICYVNAGHSHAFRIDRQGETLRLGATSPPFGMVDLDHYVEATAPWTAGEDLLLLFTDGLSDGLGLGELAGERILLEEAVRGRDEPTHTLLQRLFSLRGETNKVPADDRSAVLVRI
jgi:phosphoserine phosphatase RsbU/P